MTAPYARQPRVVPRPACVPAAIRALLAANASGGILQRYDEDLDAAFEQAREQGDVTPLRFENLGWQEPAVWFLRTSGEHPSLSVLTARRG